MAGLQRSAVSFRRQGSSGHVWDDKFLGELIQGGNQKQETQQQQQNEQRHEISSMEIKQESTAPAIEVRPARTVNTIERSRSNGGGQRGYRTGKVSPAFEPPSPKVSACGFCGAFGSKPEKGRRKKAGMGRSR